MVKRLTTHISTLVRIVILAGAVSLTGCSPSSGDDANTNLDSLLVSAIRKTNALNFEQAHAELTRLISLAKERGDEKNHVLGTINMGALYFRYNVQDEALKYFLTALELARQSGQDDLLNTIYNNIGIIYSTNHATEKAIEYYEQALEISRKQKNQHRTAVNLLNLGTEVNRKADKTKAYQYLRQALDIFLTEDDILNASVSMNNLGDIHLDRKEYDSALYRYRRALAMSSSIGDQYYKPQYCINIGKTFYAQQQYDSAEAYFQESLQGFQRIKATESMIEGYQWLSQIASKKRNLEKALEDANQSRAWQDTLLKEKTSKWISELQMRYEFGKQETEIELLQAKAYRQRLIWSGAIGVAVIVALFVFFILRSKNINLEQKNIILEKEQEVNRLTLEKNKAERDQLEKDILVAEKLNALEKQKLLQELTFKDRELAAKALHLVNKNETFASMQKILSVVEIRDNPAAKSQLEKVKKIIKGNNTMDQEWETFKLHFEEVHPRFFSQLKEFYPTLSGNDMRLSAYLLLDLNPKEIANIFNISPESVRKKKQRLREKLNLEKDEDIKIRLDSFRQTAR